MNDWNTSVLPRVTDKAKLDADYNYLFRKLQETEKIYLEIMEKLSIEERELVGDYIALCEDMEYRKAQLAYDIGVSDGTKQSETRNLGTIYLLKK